MFNAATLKEGRLTLYCTDHGGSITIAGDPTDRNVTVILENPQTTYTFRGTGILRIRILALGAQDLVNIGDAYLPNVTDVAVYCGDGGGRVYDSTTAHRFSRAERVSLIGGAGDDTLWGGAHTVSIAGGAGNDSLAGGAAGAVLDGGDGNDLVSAAPIDATAAALLAEGAPAHSVSLIGGAGDDVLVGNRFHTPGVTDTLTGAGGNDSFYAFSTDQITDYGVGLDTQPAANQFTPPALVTQTATLAVKTPNGPAGTRTDYPAQGLGDNGPNNRIAVTDSLGTITMQGPAGSQFLLGDLFEAAGYPVSRLGIPSTVTLTVNGFVSSLTGDQIPGYEINNGDAITLSFIQ